MARRSLALYEAWWRLLRDILLFFVGMCGIAWETIHGPVDPSLLVFFGGCLGLPVVLWNVKK